jgi:hypothetical protein
VTIGLFETTKITRQTLVMNLNKLLYSFGLRKKIITFVKYEGTNWNAMISTLMFVVNYDIMGLEESFNGSCFGHFFPRHANMGLPRRRFAKT